MLHPGIEREMTNQNLSLESLYQAIVDSDPGASMKGISYEYSLNNELDPTWWVFIPFGGWQSGSIVPPNPPSPSPLEDGFNRTVASAGTDRLFIDITHLDRANSQFSDAIVGELISAINSVPPSVAPVIRYLQGYAPGATPTPMNDGLVRALFNNQDSITNTNAMLYFGAYSPSFHLSVPGQDSLTGFWTSIDDLLDDAFRLLTKKIVKVDASVARQFETIKGSMKVWIRQLLIWIQIPQVSWNHTKIVAANGRALMTGGGNYWAEYTTGSTWLFDLQMRIRGDAATAAHHMCDYMWTYLANKPPTDTSSVTLGCNLKSPIEHFTKQAAPLFQGSAPSNPGSVAALSVGNIGNWPIVGGYPVLPINAIRDFLATMIGAISAKHGKGGLDAGVVVQEVLGDDSQLFQNAMQGLGISRAAWASRAVRNLAIGRSSTVLRLAQQKLAMDDLLQVPGFQRLVDEFNKTTDCHWDGFIWPYDTLVALGQGVAAMNRNPQTHGVQLITSYYSRTEGYQNPVSDAEFLLKLVAVMNAMRLSGAISFDGDAELVVNKIVHCRRIAASQPKAKHACHCKLVVADDSVVYIGSDNAYPAYCEEHGLWVGDQSSIDDLITNYWNGLWEFAQPQ
jgi:hypothetical protein